MDMLPMLFSKALEGYRIDRIASGYSPKTLEIHGVFLARLDDYLGHPMVDTIRPGDLTRFMYWLQSDYVPPRIGGDTSPLKPASIDGAWKSIRSFFKWAHEALELPRPDLDLKRPRYTPTVMKSLSEKDVKALLKATEHREYTRRNKAVILLMVDTGLRLGEVSRLLIRDVNLSTGEILVTPYLSGLKSRPRTVWLGQAARRALWLYLSEREYQPKDSVFDMSDIAIRLMIRRAGNAAGLNSVHPHQLRHTFAVTYLRFGGDVFTLQRLLGHQSMDMVRRYLDLADTDTESAHKIASPADRWKL